MATPEDVASNPTIATIIQGRLSGNVSTELMLIWHTLYTPNKHALYVSMSPSPSSPSLSLYSFPLPKGDRLVEFGIHRAGDPGWGQKGAVCTPWRYV